MTKRANAFARREEGMGSSEYILIALIVAIASVAVVAIFGQNARGLFSTSSNSLAGNTSALAEKDGTEEACGLACTFKCFVAGTPVLLSSGERKPIEQVAHGDWVLAPASLDDPHALSAYPVVGTVRRLAESLCDITLAREGAIETLSATPEHPFAVVRDQRAQWVAAELLEPGDEVAAGASVARVVHVERRIGPAEVFNLQVETAHAFLVGEVGALVHNIGCGDESDGSSSGSKKRGDHLLAYGLGKAVGEKLDGAAQSLPPDLADAFSSAKGKLDQLTKGPAFQVTIDKGPTPAGGDAQSRAFGEALQDFRGKFDAYVDAVEDVETSSGADLAAARAALQRATDALNESFGKVLAHTMDSEVASEVGSKDVKNAEAALASAKQIVADMTKSIEEKLRR